MLIDTTLVLSDKQALTVSCASENTIDQAAAGNACPHAMVVAQTAEDFAGLTALKISLQTSDQADFEVCQDLLAKTFTLAELTGGKTLLNMALPLGAKRYIRGYYQVTGTATAGKLSLFVADRADQ